VNTARCVPFAGRLLIGFPFLLFGLGKVTAYGATVAMIEAVYLAIPMLSFLGAVTLEIVGGALLVAGYEGSTGRRSAHHVFDGCGPLLAQQSGRPK